MTSHSGNRIRATILALCLVLAAGLPGSASAAADAPEPPVEETADAAASAPAEETADAAASAPAEEAADAAALPPAEEETELSREEETDGQPAFSEDGGVLSEPPEGQETDDALPAEQPVCVSMTAPAADGASATAPVMYSEDVIQKKMYAMKSVYPTNTKWNDYSWYTSRVLGGGSGCVGFGYLMSDAAFDDLPARTIYRGSFTYDDIRPGDLLWVSGNNSHMVAVLEKHDDHLILVEGNFYYSGVMTQYGVYWGRKKPRSEVISDYGILITRYPVNLAGDVSGNKTINNWDAALLLKRLVNPAGSRSSSEDATQDGYVNAGDAGYILAMCAMKEDPAFMRAISLRAEGFRNS